MFDDQEGGTPAEWFVGGPAGDGIAVTSASPQVRYHGSGVVTSQRISAFDGDGRCLMAVSPKPSRLVNVVRFAWV